MKIKHFLEEEQSPVTSANEASSTGLSQERTSNDDDFFAKYPNLGCFPKEMNLNPARMVLAELMGTFLLVFCICGIVASSELTRGQAGLLEYASTAGLTVIVLVFAIGPISGAHVNPAVTIAFATFGHFPWSKVPFYVAAQIIGSILATYVGKGVYGIKPELLATRSAQGCQSAFWVEFIATFIFMFLIASLKYQPSIGNLAGFVIGLAIGLAVLITGPVSGGSLNPARSLGPAIVCWNFKDIWIYIIAPTTGAIAGALMFHVLRLQCRPCTSSPNAGLLGHSIDFT
ncbi:probable aquaporin NIP7-1 [Mercurialis annua]|uniref:probable aquaporin NIP7-1 n=1 Tax=Mercurialis annua TaxID=3986 RepID=UPI00215F2488|nr:probable aquaporin NIP7-1 [Mercurialis annua]